MTLFISALLLLLMAAPAFAQGQGTWMVGPGTGRVQCTDITNPVTNLTWCEDGNPSYAIRVWNGSAYVPITGGGGGDLTAKYILQTAAGDLPNAQSLSALSTGLLVNTSGTGVLSIFTGGICPIPGSFVDGITSSGTLACGIPAGGGTVVGTGTANTVTKFSASSTITNSTITDNGSNVAIGAASFTLTNQVAGSGHTCLQVDTAGVVTQTGVPCASGSGGTVALTNSQTIASVTFTNAQPDTSYTVTLGTRPSGGSPPAVAARYLQKTTAGFSVEISAAPGTGNSINVDWAVGSGTFTTTVVKHVCSIIVGADNGPVLVDADLGPQGQQCFVPASGTILEVTIAADTGTPSVLPRKNVTGTGTTNLLSGALSTAASGGVACSNTGGTLGLNGVTTCTNTLNVTALGGGNWIELGSGTAGGSAHRMSISVTYTIP